MNPQLQALFQQAIQAFQDGNFETADLILQKVLQKDINSADTVLELGIAYAKANRFIEASAIFCCLQLYRNNDVRIPYNLGLIHSLQGKHQLALEAYDAALKIQPNDVEVLINKGSTFNDTKDYILALEILEKAIQIRSDIPEAWSNKGIALNHLNLYQDSIRAYDEAIKLNTSFHEAWSNKSAPLNKLKLYTEALNACDKALSLKPDYSEAWSNKGATLHELKRYDEAIAHYDKALGLKPDVDWIYGDLVHAKMKICDWSGLAESLESISKKVVANEKVINPFALLALNDDALLHKKSSEIYAQDKYPFNPTLGSIPKSVKKEKIRIAYISPDFRNHPISFLTAELYELHDRSRFEVFAFSLQKAPIGDETNLRLSKGFDRFIDVENMSDRDIAQLARKLEIDIAIDLAGPTQFSRTGIFSYRAAPIQVNWLGYPGTIGTGCIDYIVADETLIPESHQRFYTEKAVYLPDTYMVDDSKRTASSKKFTRENFGLPDGAFVFCCFNNDYKFNPRVLDSWSRILLKAKNSVIWISENNENFRVNIVAEFKNRGIDSDRIVFAQRVEKMADHLSRYALADLFLDTHPYNAHTTALDSLKAGVPILTLMGQSFASRVAASLLNAIGLPELITSTQEEYEALAIELAMNPQKLTIIKLKLANNRLATPLFDTPRFTKNLEAAYIKMYERYHADLEPEHIT